MRWLPEGLSVLGEICPTRTCPGSPRAPFPFAALRFLALRLLLLGLLHVLYPFTVGAVHAHQLAHISALADALGVVLFGVDLRPCLLLLLLLVSWPAGRRRLSPGRPCGAWSLRLPLRVGSACLGCPTGCPQLLGRVSTDRYASHGSPRAVDGFSRRLPRARSALGGLARRARLAGAAKLCQARPGLGAGGPPRERRRRALRRSNERAGLAVL